MAKGRYRLAINGFRCIAETWDDALNWDGQHDEIYFRTVTKTFSKDGTPLGESEDVSLTLGDVRGFVGRVQVGSAVDWLGSRTGGIVSGDSYPTPTPWMRNLDLDDTRRYPPYKIWEGDLSAGGQEAVFVTPTVWEWDPGQGALAGWLDWQKGVDSKFGMRAKEVFGGIFPVSRPFFDAVSLGIQTFATLAGLWSPVGKSMQRPIGLQRDPGDPDSSTFNPTTFALTYERAEYLLTHDLTGIGNGRVGIRYTDDPYLRGDYILYVEIDKVGTSPMFPDGSVIRETSHPEVYIIHGQAKFWIRTPDELQQFFGGWPAVRVVPDGTLAAEGIGDVPIDNVLMKETSNPTVWRMEHGAKRWVVSPTVLANYGGWSAVQLVPDGSMMQFPQGTDLTS